MNTSLSLQWNLDSIFSGGSDSNELRSYVDTFHQHLNELEEKLVAVKTPEDEKEADEWLTLLTDLQQLSAEFQEISAFIGCLNAQDMNDTKARQWQGNIKPFRSRIGACASELDAHIAQMDPMLFENLQHTEKGKPIAFALKEKKQWADEKLSPEQEKLVGELSQDGYHGWSEMYQTLVSSLSIPFEEDGKTSYLSAGQAQNKLESSNRETRKMMFKKWEAAWGEKADLFAETLNHLSGFRLGLYEKRGWEDPLKEPLLINRMSRDTLDSMWSAIEGMKPLLYTYMERKASLMGVEKLEWHDVHAPLAQQETPRISFNEGAKLITEQFEDFSPKLASFTKMAFENSWIEAEDRENKRPGGFCTTFPISNETRIFMTYEGTPSNLATLAHEIGHAYHQHVMEGLPYYSTRYAMNVAETASTFAEQIIADASIREAKSKEEKISLLDAKINRGMAFFMNLHSRYLFETRYYEARKNGWLSAGEISTIMTEAQREAYGDKLQSYDPHFWASKLHFHMTGVPFYNFPYTFGYLFSMSIYDKAKQKGTAFEEKYTALLRDTASMTTEDLAWKHLNEDITTVEFWESAAKSLLKDTEDFMNLTK